MASNTTSNPRRNVLAIAVTALLVASAVAAGVSLTAVGTASAATGIDECTTIDESGVYELASDITSDSDTCLTITASDVTVEGDGHAIGRTAELSGDTVVVVGGDDPVDNVTVTGVTIAAAGTPSSTTNAVRFENASDSSLVDVRIDSAGIPKVFVNANANGNAIRNVSTASVTALGDDTLIADTVAQGAGVVDGFSVGDGAVLRNVTGDGISGADVYGDDVVVANSTFGAGVTLSDAQNATLVDNEFRASDGVSITMTNSSSAEIRGNTISTGIEISESDDSLVVGNDIVADNTVSFGALSLQNSDDSVVKDNRIEFRLVGLDVVDSDSTLIYDNYFEVTDPDARIVEKGEGTTGTVWNVTPRSGENVVGGDTIAGNYYANAEGTGFSQTCEDADGDGVCDSAHELAEGNTDYAPLAGSTGPAPIVNGQSPTDPDADGLYEDVDGDGTFAYDDVVAFFEQFRDAAVQDHEAAYDFDGSGGVTYSDVVSLFGQI